VAEGVSQAGFLDSSFGIVVGPQNTVYYTTDGGQNWTQNEIIDPPGCQFGLDIVDEQVAWHCGRGSNQDNVRHSAVDLSLDGGQTWEAVSEVAVDYPESQVHRTFCRFLSFLDAETGWAASNFQLTATSDGGASWTDLPLPEGVVDTISGVALRTPTEGYLLESEGGFFVTQDGGQTWELRYQDLKNGMPADDVGPSKQPQTAIRFLDEKQGLIVYWDPDLKQMQVARTVDGGLSWEKEALPLKGISFPFLTHDGQSLTLVDFISSDITVLQYQ
jgi:photosystem II stability/assembly factor-like uncharacterized protein